MGIGPSILVTGGEYVLGENPMPVVTEAVKKIVDFYGGDSVSAFAASPDVEGAVQALVTHGIFISYFMPYKPVLAVVVHPMNDDAKKVVAELADGVRVINLYPDDEDFMAAMDYDLVEFDLTEEDADTD